jgi:spoIIIJ-associated protein
MVESFLGGVLAGFGLEGAVSTEVVDGDVQADVTGSNLGLLIGPKGGTIRALQEVTRAAAQRHADGRETHRINVDVAGYRERRREALGDFARRQAEIVRAEGRRVALEPMGSADRKAVHDAVLDIEGVRSISEGDDPRRRVVLIPDN